MAHPAWDFFERIHPEDRPKFEQRKKRMASTQKEWADSEIDFRIMLPDGTIKHLHSIAHPVIESGDEVFGTVMDVTEQWKARAELENAFEEIKQRTEALRRSEAYLAEAQKLTHTGSWAVRVPRMENAQREAGQGFAVIPRFGWDASYWSKEMYRIFGFDPGATPPSYMEVVQRLHPEDAHDSTPAVEQAIRDRTDFETEFRLLLPNGPTKHIHVVGHPVVNASGDVIELVGTAMDVTEQHEARADLEKAFEEIKRLRDQLHDENVVLREQIDQAFMFDEIVGTSSALQGVLSRLTKVAPTDSSVLVSGETGTGKELVARAIHKRSRRWQRAFVSVNCAAPAPSLISSELFGHEKGAFTGAMQRRLGRFELANGGTIFLDEVG